MDYEDKLSSFLTKHCNFLGIYKLSKLTNDKELTYRIKSGGNESSSTIVFEVCSLFVTQSYYALLYRESIRTIEWFDPLGMAPPAAITDWCQENDFFFPIIMSNPMITPDYITWSGEFCAYYMKWRKHAVDMYQTRWRFFEAKIAPNIIRVRRDIDFTEDCHLPLPE